MAESAVQELYALVNQIPEGRVCSYGTLGRALRNPVSGLIVGRWMSQAPPDIPWWRVVGANGQFPVGKRDPQLEQEQRDRLRAEGVALDGDSVGMEAYWDPADGNG